MKKIILTILLCGVMVLGITGCGTKKLEDMTLLERIEAAQTFDEITSCNSYKNGVQPETDEEEKALSKKAKEYILNNKKLNGIYYYNQYTKYNGYYITDKVAIYVNKENVYVLPVEENQNINKKNLSKISTMENSEMYKYKIESVSAGDYTWNFPKLNHITIDLKNISNPDINLTLYYCEDDSLIEFGGDGVWLMYNESKDKIDEAIRKHNENKLPYMSKYYTSKEKALKATEDSLKQKEYEEKVEREKDNELSSSVPKVGMSASDVRKTKWGEPDKINKDTYSWGTTEQWVYDNKGYVYFENGKVTSVSER